MLPVGGFRARKKRTHAVIRRELVSSCGQGQTAGACPHMIRCTASKEQATLRPYIPLFMKSAQNQVTKGTAGFIPPSQIAKRLDKSPNRYIAKNHTIRLHFLRLLLVLLKVQYMSVSRKNTITHHFSELFCTQQQDNV